MCDGSRLKSKSKGNERERKQLPCCNVKRKLTDTMGPRQKLHRLEEFGEDDYREHRHLSCCTHMLRARAVEVLHFIVFV